MKRTLLASATIGAAGLATVAGLAGCGQSAPPPPAPGTVVTAGGAGAPPTAGAPATGAPAAGTPGYAYKTRTGTPVTIGDPSLIQNLVASRNYGRRNDPFALLSSEQSFDRSQLAERILGEMGGFSTYVDPEPEVEVEIRPEPQPYRRLAGVLVGETVSAILIMEDGTAHLIKPGMRIPNSPWRVVSIDEEKAVLRRAGPRPPTQIVVRLESPPGGVPNPGGGQPGGLGAPGGRGDEMGGGRPGLGGPDAPGGRGSPGIG
jgi:hypothetical protein